ncbi:MAG TPA: NAD(P)H-dependent oxidoreductase [Flavitalea sp.]|nr:NAD(P)H-dependent oxidoreductase [Flavitalea sp.]
MKKILHVISSPRNGTSNSIQLGNKIIEQLKRNYPGSSVRVNNVVDKDYAHLTDIHIAGYLLPEEDKTQQHLDITAPSDSAVEELIDADIIIISLPLYNFQMPSALKAWIDHIVRKGKTFSYQTGQAEGLLTSKKTYLAIASSGVYSDGPMKVYDFAEPYLRFILGFMGLKDITTYRVEGTAIPGIMETALEKGLNSVTV